MSLPTLISKFDQVLEQLHLLFRDIEATKMDSGVVVMLRNGVPDIRGLGTADTPAAAAALLFVAYSSLPPARQAEMMQSFEQLVERSKQIATEAPLWRAHQDTKEQSC